MAGRDDLIAPSAAADWASMRPGRAVRLTVQSPLYKGVYECTVVAVSRNDVRVTMPMDDGKLVLIPVGTRVWIEVDREDEGADTVRLAALIVDRKGGADRSLLLRPVVDPSAEPSSPSQEQRLCPVVAVTSGKGGVGKSFATVNLGAALHELGLKVAVVDVDLGTANVDVLLNLSPRHTLSDVVRRGTSIFDAIVEGPRGLIVLPGASGLQDVAELTEDQFCHLSREMKRLQGYVDVMLLDTGSGVSRAVTRFVRAAEEAVLVTTPEPHAVVDAYALVKVLVSTSSSVPLHLVVNKARDREEAAAVAAKMLFAGEKFLQAKLHYLGYIVRDDAVGRAVRQQRLLADGRPVGPAAENLRHIAEGLATIVREHYGVDEADTPSSDTTPPRPRSFLQRVRELFSR